LNLKNLHDTIKEIIIVKKPSITEPSPLIRLWILLSRRNIIIMRNKKYRPWFLSLFFFIALICNSIVCYFLIFDTNIPFAKIIRIIFIPVTLLGEIFFIYVFICSLLSYIKITSDTLLIRHDHHLTGKKIKFGMAKLYKIPIVEIWGIDFSEDHIFIMLKNGYRITFTTITHPKKKQLIQAFKELQQQVIYQSKDNEQKN